MERIEFVFFDAGGGHRAAATALQIAIQAENKPWDVQLMNLQEVLDELDILKKYANIRIQDFYNNMLRTGWTLGSPQLMRVLQAVIRAYHGATVKHLIRYWREKQPDMVVSFVPHFNRALCESFRNVFPDRPFVTILTDLADYPPHFWIERQPQSVICGTDKAVAQARAMGHPEQHIFRASGMILHPRFYEPRLPDPLAEREKLGLRRDLPIALVLFGGHGSQAMLQIAMRLDSSKLPLQLILVCGRNEKLANSLRALPAHFPRFVEGFTSKVNYYMQLADFFIGKPGPGSVSEALAMQLPVIVECNAWTLPQERYNAEWIIEKEVGLVLKNFRSIDSAAAKLIEPATLARYRANASALHNRAVFEIPDMLQNILESSRRTATVSASA
ncbi:MAG TPA: glycosyltransferase [Candidatus Acidoferrales bacterium]|jgi:1,2-diacylglycerol 3-beta-galactosyltransferase|nr:glycosyltransferase [Candidatus Acidoferrales bacterium]